jgi:ATPase subunit of ABC transporter with duplicated ATPase domains
LDEIKPSSRKYPAIIFDQEREAGNQILEASNMSKTVDGEVLFSNFEINLNKGDKVAFISKNQVAVTTLFNVLNNEDRTDTGDFSFGTTITTSYLPNDNHRFFENSDNLVDWLRQYATTEEEKDEVYLRSFLGRMLFSGEEALKESNVLSGGEKVRCMLSRMMFKQANVLMFDEPTNHLDLESIQALNNTMTNFKGTILFTSHDHTVVQTVANRIVEIGPKGVINKMTDYDSYLADPKLEELRAAIY